MIIIKNLLIIIAGAAIFFGCASKAGDTGQSPVQKFILTDSMMAKIRIDTVRYSKMEDELELPGKISFDEEKVIRIFPVISGLVSEVRVALGDHVTKGEILAGIRSSEMAGFENDLTTARANLEIAIKNYSSASDMYHSGLISEKEFVTAQTELQKAKSEVKKVDNIFGSYGGGDKTEYVIKAPINGVIVEKQINPNLLIRADNNNPVFIISDLRELWVLANVFESDIPKIKPGQEVTVTTLSYGDRQFTGKIDRIYNVLDPENKTMKILVKMPNPDNLLMPEMFANVRIHYTIDSTGITIPADAVIFDNSKNYVMVYHDKNHIETREVTIEHRINDKTFLRSGLSPGEKIITKNQLLIYNALNL